MVNPCKSLATCGDNGPGKRTKRQGAVSKQYPLVYNGKLALAHGIFMCRESSQRKLDFPSELRIAVHGGLILDNTYRFIVFRPSHIYKNVFIRILGKNRGR